LYASFWETRRLPYTLISGGEESGLFKSSDGGDTWTEITRNPGLPKGLLGKIGITISPAKEGRIWVVVEAEDGAVFRSDDGGESWSSIFNQPTAEFYHVTTDSQVPYRVYGAQQDNTTISVPSRSPRAAITQSDLYEVGGGESGYVAVRSDDPNIVYAGNYQGYITR